MSNARLKRKRKAWEKRHGGQRARKKNKLRQPRRRSFSAFDVWRAKRFGKGPLADEIRRAMREAEEKSNVTQ